MSGGLKYGEAMIEAFKQLAPLKDATDMADCAEAFVMIAKNGALHFCRMTTDKTGSMTGATVTIDAGLSLMSGTNSR